MTQGVCEQNSHSVSGGSYAWVQKHGFSFIKIISHQHSGYGFGTHRTCKNFLYGIYKYHKFSTFKYHIFIHLKVFEVRSLAWINLILWSNASPNWTVAVNHSVMLLEACLRKQPLTTKPCSQKAYTMQFSNTGSFITHHEIMISVQWNKAMVSTCPLISHIRQKMLASWSDESALEVDDGNLSCSNSSGYSIYVN